MTRPRSAVLLATILALVYWAAHQPARIAPVETAYCVIQYRAVVKHYVESPDGRVVEEQSVQWVKGYGLCSEQDSYRYI